MQVLDISKHINRLSSEWAQAFETDNSAVASGFGVWLLLATLLIGASGEARTELEAATGVTQNEASSAIARLLNSIEAVDGLKSAIAIWVRDSIELLPNFISSSPRATIGSMPKNLSDFDTWAAEKTDNAIEKFPLKIKEGALMVLASAIVAKGQWEEPFREQSGILYVSSSKLNRAAIVQHGSTTISRIIVKAENGLDVYLIAGSKADSPGAVIAAGLSELMQTAKVTNGDQLREGDQAGCLHASLRYADQTKINLRLPQFKISNLHNLLLLPDTFGLESACDRSRGHFFGISKVPMVVGQAAQSATVEFGAKGFEAAAVTAIEILRGGRSREYSEEMLQLDAKFDRPFGFIIVERKSKLAVFTGWVTESAFESEA